jgi:hypothetical protein
MEKAKRLAKKEPARLAREEKVRAGFMLAREGGRGHGEGGRLAVIGVVDYITHGGNDSGKIRGGISELGMGLTFSSYTFCSFS